MSRATTRQAAQLLEVHGEPLSLRTLDALHAGAFALIAETDWCFVTADEALASAIQAMGYQTLNPMK